MAAIVAPAGRPPRLTGDGRAYAFGRTRHRGPLHLAEEQVTRLSAGASPHHDSRIPAWNAVQGRSPCER
ncbi:hypothetical protein GCM10023178_66220 [Actinomadura luteofluorescens]